MTTSPKRIALGIDVGGTKIKAVAIDTTGKILKDIVIPSHASENRASVRKSMKESVKQLQNSGIIFDRIGVGCAGSVDSVAGIVRNSPNFTGWKNVALKSWMEEDFEVPTVVENDANCALVAEWKVGFGEAYKNVVLLTLGTGIGGALILDGKLYRGSTGTAGEIGHLSIRADGVPCPCGSRGCFERYCSATAIKNRGDGVSPKEIFSKAKENLAYGKIIAEFLADFKLGLTSIANVFDPDLILLGGAVSQGVSPYLPEIHDWIKNHAFPSVGSHVQVKMTKFDNLSGAIGAALLAFEANQ